MNPPRVIHVVAADVSVLLTQTGDSLPVLAHWGPRLDASDDDLSVYATTPVRTGIDGESDVPYEPSMLPEHSFGWAGLPGLRVHRGGAGWSPLLVVTGVSLDGETVPEGAVVQTGSALVTVEASDAEAGIAVVLEIDLSAAGLLRTRATVRNSHDVGTLEIIGVDPSLRIPAEAREILDFAGRWGTEKIPQRHPVVVGTHSRSSRRGRTGLDATTVIAVGTPGFDGGSGRVWLCHVGIGGNHEHAVERGDSHLAFRGGELLLPGEVRLASGESYASPWIYGSFGVGLDDAAARYHAFLRERSRASRRPRPVTLNVWEAVYFDQDLATLSELADRAAALGMERYVLDDGWFLGRSDDRAGLGDWTVDPAAWPQGLAPLADHVRGLGMEFGLWVEPEMINEDSDLARAHPDWILRTRDSSLPARWRFQQVLDLTNPDAFTHILEALDTLIRDLDVAYLKWDHNRDLVDAGHPATGAPAVHEQTLAVYRLMDELRARHSELEIESCASGGGRVDLGVLERTDRVHTSDNHDPLDRTRILRWTGLLVPPEMLGSHVASDVSSVTGRTSDLHTRCAVAFLGHFGVEWDLRELDEADTAVLGRWIAAYREHRDLIATGRVVGSGDVDPDAPTLRGVVALDGSEALYTLMTPVLSADTRSRVRLPGLLSDARYRVEAARPESLGPWWLSPRWLESTVPLDSDDAAPSYSGSLLREAGLDLLAFHPDRVVVLRLVRVS